MIIVRTKFPKNKKSYEKIADKNINKLLKAMEDIIIAETEPKPVSGAGVAYRPTQNSNAWSYSEKKKKAKTFKL